VSIAQIELARAEAAIATVQNRLSLAERDDLPTVAYCEEAALRYLAYQPLNGSHQRRDDPVVADIARRLAASVPQIWLAWILAQGAHVMPLVGASRPETIAESARAGEFHLTPDALSALQRRFAPDHDRRHGR
jgi:diketogulonate reductase-like aldo/keto reductase